MKIDLTEQDYRFPGQRPSPTREKPKGKTPERRLEYQRRYRERLKARAVLDPNFKEVLRSQHQAWNIRYYAKLASQHSPNPLAGGPAPP